MTTPALLVDGNMEDEKSLLVQKANAFDLISDFTAGTPFLSEIAYVSRPAFPTASTEAKAMNTNSSLIHRALGDHPHWKLCIFKSFSQPQTSLSNYCST